MRASALLAAAFLLPTGLAHAALDDPADTGPIWTLSVENDVISTTPHRSDQNYTAGQQLGWTSGAQSLPDVAARLATRLWSGGMTRIGLGLAQQLYTPTDTRRTVPDPQDRPYAGFLAATGTLMHDSGPTRDILALTLGVIGPLAQGAETQNGFHRLIKDSLAQGWSHQLPNAAAVELLGQRTWRLPIARPDVARRPTDLCPDLADRAVPPPIHPLLQLRLPGAVDALLTR